MKNIFETLTNNGYTKKQFLDAIEENFLYEKNFAINGINFTLVFRFVGKSIMVMLHYGNAYFNVAISSEEDLENDWQSIETKLVKAMTAYLE